MSVPDSGTHAGYRLPAFGDAARVVIRSSAVVTRRTTSPNDDTGFVTDVRWTRGRLWLWNERYVDV